MFSGFPKRLCTSASVARATHTVFVGRTRPSTWLEPFGGLINNSVLLMQLLPRRTLRGIALCAGTRALK